MKKVKKTTIICIKCMKTPTTRDTIKCKAWLFSAKNCDIVLIKTSPLLFVQVLKFGAGGDWNKNNPSLTLRVHMVKGVTSIFLIFLANIISVGHEKFVKVSKFLLSLRSNLRRRQI